MDMTKRQKSKKGPILDALAREDNLSMEARVILQNLAIEFVEACFNCTSFLGALQSNPLMCHIYYKLSSRHS
jgi:replication fork protection complex subunit Tof1/Swi1